MKKTLFIFAILIFLFGFSTRNIFAQVKLDSANIRLNRLVTGQSPLNILVVIKTASSVTENGLKIKVGNAWTISNNNSDFTIQTTGLPSGVSAWPGIGQATSVNGQTIDFPSGDLLPNQSYGFFITGGFSNNPSVGTGQNYLWQVSTLTSSGVDSLNEINIPIIASDQIVVTGRVPANASDFQLEMTADKSTDLKLGDEITYQINYGSYLQNYTRPLKISASWSRGTVSGSLVPSVDILDYVIGSASTAFGEVEPVIDIINRQIIWTITSFPANTINETVTFKLKVNDSYTGSSQVNFDVSAYLDAANVLTVSTVSNNFFKPTITPTPTLAPTSTSSSSTSTTTSSTPTPTPTSNPESLKIEDINIVGLSSSGLKITTSTNQTPQQIKIKYGESPNQLTDSITSINALKNDFLKINDLNPGTDYFFKIEVLGSNGKIVSSDIYTFRTPVISDMPQVDKKSLIVSVSDSILLDSRSETDESNSVVITPNQNYAFRLNISRSNLIKSIKVSVINSQILGINTVYGAEPNSATVDLLEISNGGFIGHLISPKIEGFYDVVARIEDSNGNISEEKIGTIRVINPLSVYDQEGEFVENAKVIFYIFNSQLNLYELIPSGSSGIKNPSFTETNGELKVVLPKGKYKIEVSEIGFIKQEIYFSLGLGENEKMPRVVLIKAAIGLPSLFQYYTTIISDVSTFSGQYLNTLTSSVRFFKLISVLIFITGLVMVWFLLSNFYKLPWWMLPTKLINQFNRRFQKNDQEKLQGTIVDKDTGMPVDKALVYLLDNLNSKVLSKDFTDKLGMFYLTLKSSKSYGIAVIKDGYDPTPIMGYTKEGLAANNLIIKIENVISRKEQVEKKINKILQKIGNILISIWLLFSLISEFIFWHNFTWSKIWFWFLVSCFNIIAWLKITLKLNDKK